MAERKRTERVTLSLTPEERETLDAASDRTGIPHTILARLGALEKARRDLAQLERDRRPRRQPQAA